MRNLDYTCAGCGAAAETAPDPRNRRAWGKQIVVVPHARGCPVAIQVAAMHAGRLAELGHAR